MNITLNSNLTRAIVQGTSYSSLTLLVSFVAQKHFPSFSIFFYSITLGLFSTGLLTHAWESLSKTSYRSFQRNSIEFLRSHPSLTLIVRITLFSFACLRQYQRQTGVFIGAYTGFVLSWQEDTEHLENLLFRSS